MQEALQERADINRNIEQLKKRLNNNVLSTKEGEQNSRRPREKTKSRKLDNSLERLTYLIAHINQTNCETKIDGETTNRTYSKKRYAFC